MINEYKLQEAMERAKDAQRLGGYNVACSTCPESDPRCLEQHHLGGRGYDKQLICLCGNCHKKQTDKTANKPAPATVSQLDQIGHWLLGLAELLFALAERALEFGKALIEASKVCPKPYGYMEVPS